LTTPTSPDSDQLSDVFCLMIDRSIDFILIYR
jgi:hypothetical protein